MGSSPKVLFLFQNLTPASENLLRFHKSLGFEISVLTQKNFIPPRDLDFEWLCAMKTWSFFEITRVSLHLFMRKFDIIHGVADDLSRTPIVKFLLLSQNFKALHHTKAVLSIFSEMSLQERILLLLTAKGWDGIIFHSKDIAHSDTLRAQIPEKLWNQFKPIKTLDFPSQLHWLTPYDTIQLQKFGDFSDRQVVYLPGSFSQLEDQHLQFMIKTHQVRQNIVYVLSSWGGLPLRRQKIWLHQLDEHGLGGHFLVLEQPWFHLRHPSLVVDLSHLKLSMADLLDRLLWIEGQKHQAILSETQVKQLDMFRNRPTPTWVHKQGQELGIIPESSEDYDSTHLIDQMQNEISRFYSSMLI